MSDPFKTMSFLDHLEELRWRIIKSLIAIVVGAIVTILFVDPIIDILIQPTREVSREMILQVLTVQGMFMLKWGIAFAGGLVFAIPVLTYQIWKFVSPGLYQDEQRFALPLIVLTFVCFLLGIVFAYEVIIPFSLNFFTSMGYGDIQTNVSINYYFSFIIWLMIGTGFIFEFPIVSFILARIGLLTPKGMRKYRRHAIVFIMILSAIITPPDPVSMVIMTIPLVLLYEFSIGVVWVAVRQRERR
ncbi:MAG: twin-arginine translocase subunit TatC [Candidatus Neomarinimicrobiota bacterium]|nr:MAG: twin-arginine translocase subunit TatC [Candidatus Neomarinimicrobiota bacterium]